MVKPVKKKRKVVRREMPFCTDLVKELKRYGWAFKIPDSPYQEPKEDQNVFSPPKKFDIVCCSKRTAGKLTAIEAKMWKLKGEPTHDGILKILRKATAKNEGQLDSLLDVVRNGGRSFIVMERYIPRASQYYLVRCDAKGIRAGDIMKCYFVKDLASEITYQR